MFGKTTKKEENLRDEIDELREEHEQVLTAFNNDKARTQELEKTNKNLEKEIAEKTKQLEALYVDFDDIKAKRESAIEAVNKELEIVTAQRDEKKAEVETAVAVLERTQDDYTQQVESGTTELSKLEKEIVKLETKAAKLTEKVESLELNKFAIEGDIRQAEDTLSGIYEQAEKAKKALDETKAQTDVVVTRIEEDARMSISKVEEREARVIELDTEIKTRETGLENAGITLKTLTDEIAELQTDKSFLESEKEKVVKQEIEARKHHQHVLAKEDYLRAKYEAIGMQYPELK